MSSPTASADSGVGWGTAAREALWAVTAAFGAYFCMYAFRKPFTAAAFAGECGAFGCKALFVTSQVAGYAVSKFIGIRVVSETRWERRVPRLLGLIAVAQAGLFLFAVVPRPWNAAGLLINGLALGMVFGMVLGFLEGRRLTEALTAGLCASFILADGVAKTLGFWLLELGVSERDMPAAAGLLFVPPLLLFAAMLQRIPRPSAYDERERAQRTPMNRSQRRAFLRSHGFAVGGMVTMYLSITILRSFRADFQPELFRELGQPVTAGVFARTELAVMLGVLLVNGLSSTIRCNRSAFLVALGVCLVGLTLAGAAVIPRSIAPLNGSAFMIVIGLGIYLPYVAVHTTLFERLLALSKSPGNLGFLMYIADAVGYVGYAGVMLVRGAFGGDDVLPLFRALCGGLAFMSVVALAIVWLSTRRLHIATSEKLP